MPAPEKRLPGQSNAAYERSRDPNSEFIGTQGLYGGGDPSWAYRGVRALLAWIDKRRGRGTRQP